MNINIHNINNSYIRIYVFINIFPLGMEYKVFSIKQFKRLQSNKYI